MTQPSAPPAPIASKQCPGPCKRVLELIDKNFGIDKTRPDGRRRLCKQCVRDEFRSRRKSKRAAREAAKQANHVVETQVGGTVVVQRLPGDDTAKTTKWPSVEALEASWQDPRQDAPAEPAKTETKVKVVVVEETITQVEEHRLKKRVKNLEEQNRELVAQLSDGGEYAEIVAEVLAKQSELPPPAIAPRERKSGQREATPLILASDWHVEEEVRPEQVAGRNRYNLEIATRRMERFFESSMWAWRKERQTFKIRDCIAWFGGDLITNFLHEENKHANLLSPTEAIAFAESNIIKGIEYWLTDPEMERYTIPLNDGNHGRTTRKMESSTRTKMSLEVLLYAHIANHFRNEPRLRFILPTSSFTFLDNVYGRTIRFCHGDVINYQGGIGGITVPLFRALGRWEKTKHADLTCMGHFHQRYCLPDVMVNGSLIGFNSYAIDKGFAFEPPVQSMRILEPLRWCSDDIPLWVSEREDDIMNAEYDAVA